MITETILESWKNAQQGGGGRERENIANLNLLAISAGREPRQSAKLLNVSPMGLDEKFSRLAEVSAKGLAYSVPGAWHAVKHDFHPANWKSTGMKILTASAMGAGMRIVMPETGTLKTVAGAAITLCFLRDAAVPVRTAWRDVTSGYGDEVMNQAARNLGNALGAFAVDSYLSSKAAQIASQVTPVYAERYLPGPWRALENWKDSHFSTPTPNPPGQWRYGIGIAPPEQAAIQDGVLCTSIDTGHCFAYVRDGSGRVTDVISTGPADGPDGVEPDFASPKINLRFALGLHPSRGDYPVQGEMSVYEWPITREGYEKARKLIQSEKLNPGNYTPFHDCPTLPVEFGRELGFPMPSGISLVQTPVGTFPFANPYGLEQQLNRIHSPKIGIAEEFQGPALTNAFGVKKSIFSDIPAEELS
jgi:hypothetical protein